jgi:glycosyltransferase involved in cell wall biosynthesis
VVFIEEPMPGAAEDRLEILDPAPNVQVWRPHLRGSAYGYHPEHHAALKQLVAQAAAERGLEDYFVWFYTPMALPVAEVLEPSGVIYDSMDELSAFKNAPPQLLPLEEELFRRADVVFTGGRSLFNAKRNRHHNVHCFPSSVDARHFRKATADHPLHAGIARPRLGYCGVIDERLDLDMIGQAAALRPDWQFVMVGPVVKIDPATLPQAPNIHWLGQQGYDELPGFISGWDVCMLPFALNESTRFISPTKTLEYMACGRPSIGTAIRDVVEPYGHVVPIVSNAAEFIAAAEQILARDAHEQETHAKKLAEIVALTSWDATAQAMAELIAQVQGEPAAEDTEPALRADQAEQAA